MDAAAAEAEAVVVAADGDVVRVVSVVGVVDVVNAEVVVVAVAAVVIVEEPSVRY